MGMGGGTPLKARRGEVVSPATGGRRAAPRGLRINTRARAGGGERREPRPGHAPDPAAGWDFGGSWTRQWGREVGPWRVISQSANQSADQSVGQ